MKRIPIKAAKQIAKEYGYDQVIIVARKVGENGGEHMTTYGKNKEHCEIAGQCGKFLQEKVMGWHDEKQKGWKPTPGVCSVCGWVDGQCRCP